jgi:hypothetical protein
MISFEVGSTAAAMGISITNRQSIHYEQLLKLWSKTLHLGQRGKRDEQESKGEPDAKHCMASMGTKAKTMAERLDSEGYMMMMVTMTDERGIK